jgi:hypothetical protein
MASVTLAESAKLAQEDLISGVIESIVTVDRFFEVLRFDGIVGNALKYNREGALGDTEYLGVGSTITAKNAATFVEVTAGLTTIAGDAEVNGLVQATRSSDGNDQTQTQIASKAKHAGRAFKNTLINGDGTGNTFQGLLALVAPSQTVAATLPDGDPLSFERMDEVMDLVLDKDGDVDYLMLHRREIRAWKVLLRALGGASINEVVELPSGSTVPAYSGVPVFANDYLPVDQTQGMSVDATTMFAGSLDEGGRSQGIAGLTAEMASGLGVEDVGTHFDKDERVWRVKWYVGLALFSELGLAAGTGIVPAP